MFNGIFQVPEPVNEPILQYRPGSGERAELSAKLKEMLGQQAEVPMIIGGKKCAVANLRIFGARTTIST